MVLGGRAVEKRSFLVRGEHGSGGQAAARRHDCGTWLHFASQGSGAVSGRRSRRNRAGPDPFCRDAGNDACQRSGGNGTATGYPLRRPAASHWSNCFAVIAQATSLWPERQGRSPITSSTGSGPAPTVLSYCPIPPPRIIGDFANEVVPILQRRGLFKRDYVPGTLRRKLGLPAVEGGHGS